MTHEAVLAKYPPTLLFSSTRSLDMSAAITTHTRFLKLGLDSSFYIMEGGWHRSSLREGMKRTPTLRVGSTGISSDSARN